MCSILSLAVVLGLYVIYYIIKVCRRINYIFVMNFCYDFFVSQFSIKLIELKVNNYTPILPQIYVFYGFQFLIEIFLDHEFTMLSH